MPADPSFFVNPELRKKYAPQIDAAEQQAEATNRELDEAAREQQKQQELQQKEQQVQANVAAETSFKQAGRPYYKSEADQIVPEQDDVTWQAAQQKKQQAAAQEVQWKQEGRKYTTNSFDGSLIPLESDEALAARRKQEGEELRRQSITAQMKAVAAEAGLAPKPLTDSERRLKERDLKKARQDAAFALTPLLSERAKQVSGGDDFVPFNEAPTPEAQRAQERLQRLSQPDADLEDDDIADLDAADATKPIAERLRSTRQLLSGDDEARKAQESTRQKMAELQLRRDAPDVWEARQREKAASMDLPSLQKHATSSAESLQTRIGDLNGRSQAIQQQGEQWQGKAKELEARNAEALKKGIPAGEMVTLSDGSTWHRPLAIERAEVDARAQAWQSDPEVQKQMKLLDIERAETEREVRLHQETVALTNQRRKEAEQKQLAALSEIPAMAGHGAFLQSLRQEQAVRAEAIRKQFPEGGPEAEAALAALQQDVDSKWAPVRLAMEEADRGVGAAVNRAYDMVTQGEARGTNRDQALQTLQQETGVSPQKADKMLADAERSDWSRGEEKEQARVLSDGRVIVRPALWTNEAGYRQAVSASAATPEAKESALQQFPQLREQSASAQLEALSTLTAFRDWQGKQQAGMSSVEMLEKFSKEHGWWRTQRDQLLMGMAQGVVGLFQSGVGAYEWLTQDKDSADLYERLDRDAQALGGVSQALPSGQWTALGANLVVGSLPTIAIGGPVGQGIMKLGMGILPKAVKGSLSLTQATNLARGLQLSGVAGTAGLQTFGQVYGEAVMGYQSQGFDLREAQQKAALPAFASGFSTMALTALGGFTGVEALAKLGADKALKKNLGQFAKAVFGGALKEGALEELPDQLIQSAIAVASYDPNRPLSQILEEAAIAFFGGAAMGGTFEGLSQASNLSLSGQQQPTTSNLPETVAAAEAAIDGYTKEGVDEATVARTQATARTLLYIAQGDIDSLPDSDLALVGIGRTAEGKLENIETEDGQPPRVKIEKGQAVITQPALDRLAQEMPAVRAAIGLDESGRRQQINQPAKANAPTPNDPGQTTGAPTQSPVAQPQNAASPRDPDPAANSGAAETQLTEEAQTRADQLAVHLADRGLTEPQARAAAQAVVAEQGVVGAEYTEQVVASGFDDALGRQGWVRGSGRKYVFIPPTDNARPAEATISPAAQTAGNTAPSPESTPAKSDARGASGQGPVLPATVGGRETQGAVVASPAATAPDSPGLDTDAFVVARQAAIAATPPAKRKGAVKLLGALERALTRYASAFDGVRFTSPDGKGLNLAGGGLVVTRDGKGGVFLDVDLSRWADQHSGFTDTAGIVAQTEVEEEFIHRAAVSIFTDADMRGFWRSLPADIQEMVYRGYHAADIANGSQPKAPPAKFADLHATQLGHEFLRMLVQDSAFKGKVSEAVAADPALGERILGFLRRLVDELRRLIDKAPADTRVTIREYEARVTKEVNRLRKSLPDPLRAKESAPNLAQTGDTRASVVKPGLTTAPRTDFAPVTGAKGTAHTDSNDAIEYEWAVVDVNSLNISNQDDGKINPDYPQELQPRDRTSAGSESQVSDIAKNMNLDRLSASSGVGDGAPIIGPDGVVESGNGRVMGMRRAHGQDTSAARVYASRLAETAASYGLTKAQVEAVKNPVLVRVRTTPVDRVAFVLAANVSTIAPKREIEQAKIDAKQIVPDLFGTFVPSEDGQVFTAANADFIRGFISAIIPPAERPAIIDAKGNLTQTGLRRIRNALFVHAYGDSPEALNALARLTESIESSGSNIASALVAAAPRFAEQNARIASGALYPLSLTGDLAQAVQILQDLRNKGEKVADFLAQDRIPGIGDDPTPVQKALLQFLDDNAGRPRAILAALNRYASAVDGVGDPKQASLFGGDQRPTIQELWTLASKLDTASLAKSTVATDNLTPQNALRVYRKLKKIEAEKGSLSGFQAQTLERAERALGQLFMFDDSERVSTAYALEQEDTASPGGFNAEQLSLFTSAKSLAQFDAAVAQKSAVAAEMEKRLTPAFLAAVEDSLRTGNPPKYPGLERAMPSPSLDRDSRIVEATFFQQIASNPQAAMAAYLKLAREDFGNPRYLNADLARSVLPEYAEHAWFRTAFDGATIAPAGYITLGLLLPRFLTQRKNASLNQVLLLAGGPSSGKTTVASKILKPALDQAVAIVDSVMGSPGGSNYLIQSALNAGIRPTVAFIYRPFDNAALHALKRLAQTGRPVNVEATARLHYDAQKTFIGLNQEHAGVVNFKVLANDGKLEDIREESLDFLRERAYYISDDNASNLAGSYRRIVEAEYDEGGLTPAQYAAARWGRVDQQDRPEIEGRNEEREGSDGQGGPSEGLVSLSAGRRKADTGTGDLFAFGETNQNLNLTPLLSPQQQQIKQEQAVQLDLFAAPVAAPKKPETATEEVAPVTDEGPVTEGYADRAKKLSDQIHGIITGGTKLTWERLFSMADAAFEGSQAAGTYTVKDAYDALEMGINKFIVENAQAANSTPSEAQSMVRRLKDLLANVPTQTKRTDEMDTMQQFSTVPSLAFMANWVADVRSSDLYLEPSAGVGGLAAFGKAAGARVIANELSPRRASLLRVSGIADQVFEEDAEQINNVLPQDIRPTVVVMNPPFSTSARGGKDTANAIKHIESALARLPEGGRLVAIVGEGMALGRPSFRAWWQKMQQKHHVRANVQVNGAEYAKYGTTWDNQLVVIDKVTPPQGATPLGGRVEKIDELPELLYGIRNDRPRLSESVQGPPRGGGPTSVTDTTGSSRTGSGTSGSTSDAGSSLAGNPGAGLAGTSGTDQDTTGGGTDRPGVDSAPTGDAGENGRLGRAQDGGNADRGTGVDTAAPSRSEVRAAEEMTEAVYDAYQPRISFPGAKMPPTNLAESAAMAAVEPPAVTYRPSIPTRYYADPARGDFDQRLSAHALEAVALAGHAHSQTVPASVLSPREKEDWEKRFKMEPPERYRRGFFIGDGTGAGKGRQIAAVIFDNWNQGRKRAVWISEPNLYTDARRDLNDVAELGDKLFEINGTKAGEPLSRSQGIGFISYSTLRSQEQKPKPGTLPKTRVDQIVEWLGEDFDGVIAFDEAHNMGSAMTQKGNRGMKDASRQALAGLELQQRLPNARVLYLSATGATEVSNLAYAERLGLWGPGTPFKDRSRFVDEISSGGVAAMELIAQNLKAMGLYVARSISWHDVSYDRVPHALTREQRQMYDNLAEAWQLVLRNMDEAMKLTGITSDDPEDGSVKTKNSSAKSAIRSKFWGGHQRFFNQLITAMKMPTALQAVEKALKADQSVVIQLVNTQEASLGRAISNAAAAAANSGEEVDLETLDLSPRDQLLQLVQNGFPVIQMEDYTYEDSQGNSITASKPVLDSKGNPVLNQEAVRMRDNLLDKLSSIKVPSGPLEMILDHFGPEKVAEVTGRTRRVVWKKDSEGRTTRSIEKRTPENGKREAADFQEGTRRILVFSKAGGTGRSFHADRRAKNQQKRVHILLQPGWQASAAVQGFGRTHRNNQVVPPHYLLAETDIVGEKRFMSSIARRLDQLGALTKGQRQTGSQGFFQARDNLESLEAKAALDQFYQDVLGGRVTTITPDVLEQEMGLKMRSKDGAVLDTLPPITQFLNRLLSLTLDTQNAVFDAFSERLDRIIETKLSAGTLDQGLENLNAQRTVESGRQTVYSEAASGAKAELVTLTLTQPTQRTDFRAIRRMVEFSEQVYPWARSKRTKKLFGLTGRRNTTMADGSVVDAFRVQGVTRGEWVPVTALWNRYERVMERADSAAIQQEWSEQFATAPATEDETVSILTGTMLPIWDKIPGHPRIVRAQTEDGKRMIGRVIPSDLVADMVTTLTGAKDEAGAAEAIKKADKGQRVRLSNGWTLKTSRVSGDERYELIGPALNDHTLLDAAGILRERIQFSMRYFLPTGRAEAVLENVLTSFRASIGEPASLSSGTKATKGFYSQLHRVLVEKMPNRADVGTIRGIVANPQNRIKQEELKWSGLVTWLDSQSPRSLTKDEVLGYLDNEGRVIITEVQLSQNPQQKDASEVVQKLREKGYEVEMQQEELGLRIMDVPTLLQDGDPVDPFLEPDDVQQLFNAWQAATGSEKDLTRYSAYSLPGGSNYREVLLTLPPKFDSDRLDDLRETTQRSPTEESEYQRLIARETAAPRSARFISNHFSEVPNYLAHYRANDRNDQEGRPGTFIEELQSDRHQQGRNKGYQEDGKKQPTAPPEKPSELDDLDSRYFLGEPLTPTQRHRQQELSAEYAAALEKWRESNLLSVPDAPYRKDWPLALFKRALVDAVATGKSWIGWTTGDTQASRYDLSKEVEGIDYWKSDRTDFPEQRYGLTVRNKAGRIIFATGIATESEMADAIGKELAQRIVDSAKPEKNTLAGLDLKVGGEGMKTFYDTMLPKEIGKYVKQWGGQVVRDAVLTGATLEEWTKQVYGRDNDVSELTDEMRARYKPQQASIWRVNITPAMRTGVEAGLPLFTSSKRVNSASLATSSKSAYDGDYGSGNRLDRRTSGASFIRGSRVTAEQGQAIRDVHFARLTTGQLRKRSPASRKNYDWTPGSRLASELSGFFGVPILTPQQAGQIQALPFSNDGAEGTVYFDRENGVVYKRLALKDTDLPAGGMWPHLGWTSFGRLEWGLQPADNPRNLGIRLAVMTDIGGTPTEVAAIGPQGHIYLKQPLSPNARIGDNTDFIPQLENSGVVDVPQDAVAYAFNGAFVAVVRGRPWLVLDLHEDNFVGDNQGDPRINDPVIANISTDVLKNVPGLAAVVRQAAVEAKELGDRAARLFSSSKAPASPLAKLGWNHLDRAVSAKVAAHTRWLNEKTGAGEAVARWMGAENVRPFVGIGRVLQRELFPDSVLPREIAARKREMEIKTALGAQHAMDLVRALSGTPKFSDIAYPPEFSQNPAHRRDLYLAMTGEKPMSSLPEPMQALAKRLRNMLLDMGREAVKQGRMSLDTFTALQDGYMPHYYKEDVQKEKSLFHRFRLGIRDILAQRTTAWHIVDHANKDTSGLPRIVSWQGNQWRFRNEGHRDAFYEDFILQQALEEITNRNGKANRNLTLSDLRAPAKLPDETRGRLKEITRNLRARYTKEKPLSVEEQERAGLIMDPVYAIARYMAQSVHDNSTAEFFNFAAANPEWTSTTATPGFTEIPDNPRFGRLAGKYVTDDVARQILEMVEAPNIALQIYDTILGWWKTGKTVLNPGTHVRNVLGNIFFSQLAGTSVWNPGNVRFYRESISALRNGGRDLQEAYEMGVLGADFVSAELRQTLRQLLPDPATINEDKPDLLMGIGKAIGKFVPQILQNPAHRAYNQIAALYQAEDEVFKMATYLKAKAMGMTAEQARDHVRQWFPYFDKGTSGTLKTLGRTAMPFLGFYRESVRIFGLALKERPIALAAGLAVPSLITFLSALLMGLDDDELDQVRKDMRGQAGKLLGPTPLEGQPLFSMLLPVKSDTGALQQWDISAVHPFVDFLGNRVESGSTEDWWQKTIRSVIAAGPIGSLLYSQMTGRDTFGDRTFVENNMTGPEKIAARADNVIKTLAPPLFPGGTGFQTLLNAGDRSTNKTLEVRSPVQAVVRAIGGVDLRNATPDIYRIAEDWRKANGLDTTEGMDFSASTPQSRARKALFAALAQNEPNLKAIKNITQSLKTMGAPVQTPQDVQKLLFYRNPLMIIKGQENQARFRASLQGLERETLEKSIQEFERIQARAPGLIRQAQSQ